MHRAQFIGATYENEHQIKKRDIIERVCPLGKVSVVPQFRITDARRSLAFYVKGLGFTVDWEHRFKPGFPLFAQLTRAGQSIFLTEHPGDCEVGGAAYFVVPDVDACYEEFVAHGIVPTDPPADMPWGPREMVVTDPDRNRLRFASAITPAGEGTIEDGTHQPGRLNRPYSLKADEGWLYRFGVDITVKAGEVREGSGAAFVEFVTGKGEEPPDHTHESENEMFYVLEGAVTFRCGGETLDLEQGGFVFLPRGVEHGYTVRSDDPVRLIAVTSPVREASSGGWGGFVGDIELGQGEQMARPHFADQG